MKTKYFTYIFILIAVLLLVSALTAAEEELFVNDAFSVLPKLFEGVYAVGSGGTESLAGAELYALTASGVERLGNAAPASVRGLTGIGGAIQVRSDRIRVGLAYSFSSSRDSSSNGTIWQHSYALFLPFISYSSKSL